jgi:polysaccharide deacetylase family protein (PEP-CTERM system associated)
VPPATAPGRAGPGGGWPPRRGAVRPEGAREMADGPTRSGGETPGGPTITNVLSVDVEDYFQVSAFEGHIPYASWDGFELRVEDSTRRILDLFDRAGVKATFFVLGWIAERRPRLVRELADRGHEVASHGYRHRLVYSMSPADFRWDVEHTKRVLEDVTGTPVRGFRAASFSIVPSCFWAMDVLGEAGYGYDSSMYPIRHDRYGTAGITLEPHRWPGTELVEVPMSVLPLFGLPFPIGGGGYLRHFPYTFTRWAIRRLNARHRRPVITYLHPWEVDPGQPVQSVGMGTRMRHYRGLEGMIGKLASLTEEFRFGPMAAALAGVEAASPGARPEG